MLADRRVLLLCTVRNSEQKTFIRMHSQPTPRVVLASGLPPRTQGCPADGGNMRALLSVLNKQDYARWHSYDFVLTTSTPDQTLHPEGAQVNPMGRSPCYVYPPVRA